LVVDITVLVTHGHTNAKFISAKQAKGIHLNTNIERKLYRASAAIWFNKTCRIFKKKFTF